MMKASVNRRRLIAAGGVWLGASSLAFSQETVKAIASFSILGDLVQQVGGQRVALTILVPPGADAHVYAPSPQDVRQVAAAGAIIENGLGFEGWMSRLATSARSQALVIVASKGVVPLEDQESEHKRDHKHGDHGAVDPHAWQDVANAKIYVANIKDGLSAADPAGRPIYAANASAYLAGLDRLDAEIRADISKIPPERRRIVTTHDAFGYFARAYGLEFLAPIGVSTESAISARDIGRVIAQIKAQKIPAAFLENSVDPRLIQQIARESGAKIGGILYADSLSSPDGPAATYVAMMRHNVKELLRALAP